MRTLLGCKNQGLAEEPDIFGSEFDAAIKALQAAADFQSEDRTEPTGSTSATSPQIELGLAQPSALVQPRYISGYADTFSHATSLPLRLQQRILSFLLSISEECCFYFVKRHNSSFLASTKISSPASRNIKAWFEIWQSIHLVVDATQLSLFIRAVNIRTGYVHRARDVKVVTLEILAGLFGISEEKFSSEGLFPPLSFCLMRNGTRLLVSMANLNLLGYWITDQAEVEYADPGLAAVRTAIINIWHNGFDPFEGVDLDEHFAALET
ncbi:hypothetical protein VTL71DRAFT_15746, partial [Oculimacula yallundae]